MAVDENDVHKLTSATGVNPDALVRSQAMRLKREKIGQLQRAVNEVSGSARSLFCSYPHAPWCQLNAEHKRLESELTQSNAQGRQLLDVLLDTVRQLEDAGALDDAWRQSETRAWFAATFATN